MQWQIGIDEAGRGPLAGPVSVGLVRTAPGFDILAAFPGLNDSKKLSEAKREALFAQLEQYAAAREASYAVVLKDAQSIDQRGIAVVIREAVAEGLEMLACEGAGKVWLDGSLRAPEKYEQETVIKGDSLIPSIMLASIAAKVVRDRHMKAVDLDYPLYGFKRHKGYGTAAHLETLRNHGLCAIHRRSFIHLDR